jgi:hypothetical protein
MALSLLGHGASGGVALGWDSATNERGFLVKFINRTGGNSVKGEVVAVSTATDREIIKQANEYDAIGVIAEAGIAEGADVWVWMNGSVAQVLIKDGVAAVRGYVAISADTDGRGDNIAVPTETPTTGNHWKEIGHVMQAKDAGTDVLALVCLHFN